MLNRTSLIRAMLFASALLFSGSLLADPPAAGTTEVADVYDQGAYTDYVESTMKKLDKLYLDFCNACDVDAVRAREAKQEFLVTVRDLMQHMNGRYDAMDPKQGASLSPTETLVSIHVITMLVDILAETQLEEMQPHPHID